MEVLTEIEAYRAMHRFLEAIWERTHSDDLGGLLGDMSLLPNGSTADAAMLADWQHAIEFAKANPTAADLHLPPLATSPQPN